MTTFERAFVTSQASPGEERLRLWRIEHQPEVERKYNDMMRDKNSRLGQRVREILRQRPVDHQAIARLCAAAEKEETALGNLLHEGVEAEAARIKMAYEQTALRHPDSDPTAEVREHIGNPSGTASRYCSPALMDALFWEGLDKLPNTHPKRMELDFPPRVEALLEFHCIAFHADIGVLKQMYDDDVFGDKDKRREVLRTHQQSMEMLMAKFAKDMNRSWEDAMERLRSSSPVANSSESSGTTGWKLENAPPKPPKENVEVARKRARLADTVLGPAEPKGNTGPSLPLRGILKNASAGPSGVQPAATSSFSRYTDERESELPTLDDDSDFFPGSFFRDQLLDPDDHHLPARAGSTRLQPQSAAAAAAAAAGYVPSRYASTSQQHQPTYEIFLPRARDDDDDDDEVALRSTPRVFKSHVTRLTEQLEGRIDKGKGRAKVEGRV